MWHAVVVHKCCCVIKSRSTPAQRWLKSLRKVFNSSLMDADYRMASCADLEHRLKAANRSGLPWKFKVWIYQQGILPKILWSLLIYDIPISLLKGFERRVSTRDYLGSWAASRHTETAIESSSFQICQEGIHCGTGTRTATIQWIKYPQSFYHRHYSGDWEEVEGCSFYV